ncbi:MAG: TM2 domain-containing protein [Clostridia bacterium]|nr:TM2 domain-containing protein [Clostridia bacterium]
MFCEKCGQEIAEGAEFCSNCGAAVKKEEVKEQPQQKEKKGLNGQDKTIMILMGILLGGLGIHNFMMGESKKGVVKILLSICFGIGYILSIIDVVKIATDSYTVDPEAYF